MYFLETATKNETLRIKAAGIFKKQKILNTLFYNLFILSDIEYDVLFFYMTNTKIKTCDFFCELNIYILFNIK